MAQENRAYPHTDDHLANEGRNLVWNKLREKDLDFQVTWDYSTDFGEGRLYRLSATARSPRWIEAFPKEVFSETTSSG